ncbi:MAG TPA: hypothetical protein PKO22_04160 [Treponemataceae bacterium]|nr:hypothetical protein [Treponemataceae bacterium]
MNRNVRKDFGGGREARDFGASANAKGTGHKKRHPFLVFMGVLLLVSLLSLGYVKSVIDYTGEYATDRLVYTGEYGLTLLVTYHPSYRIEKSKGFAIIHIPLSSLFSEELRAHAGGTDVADAKKTYDLYAMSEYAQNGALQTLGELLLDAKAQKTLAIFKRSFPIGKYGDYFAIESRDVYGKKEPAAKVAEPRRVEEKNHKDLIKTLDGSFDLLDWNQDGYDRFISKYGPIIEQTESDFKNQHTDGQIDRLINLRLTNMECTVYRINSDPVAYMLVNAKVFGPIGVSVLDKMLGMSKKEFTDQFGDIGEEEGGLLKVAKMDKNIESDRYWFHFTDGVIDSIEYYPSVD